MEIIILAVISLSLFIAVIILYGKNTSVQKALQDLISEKTKFETQTNQLANENSSLKEENTITKEELSKIKINLSESNQDNRYLREHLNTQKEELTRLQEHFKKEFEVLAQKILDDKTEKFVQQNEKNIGTLLKPLEEKIKEFREKVENVNKEQISRNSSLLEKIKQLSSMYDSMSTETKNLTQALRSDTKTQGNWGEFILESILEKSGLRNEYEFFTQSSYTSDNGQRFRPDVVVQLPENKQIVIDSKVSLTAYTNLTGAESEQEKATHLKLHIQSVRQHIKDLSEKKYHEIPQIKSLDFVLLFIPIEPAFHLAIHEDQKLFLDAYEKNIILVSPTTLLATLRTISGIWKQEYQNKNTLEIAAQAGRLYDKFVLFIEDLQEIGMRIQQTQNAYHNATNKLQTGKGNLIGRAQKLKKLGVSSAKELPQNMLPDESVSD